jgi:phage tail sheath gpL-like
MPNLSITSIPIVLRGGVYINQDNSIAQGGLYLATNKMLVFGQMLAGAPAVANVPIQIASPAMAAYYFGNQSMLHNMLKRIFDQAQGQGLQIWAIPQADAGGAAAAVGSVVVASQPTQGGTLAFYVGGERVQVVVTAGQSTASIATALQAACAAISTNVYFTAAVDGGNASKVNFTALQKGLVYNGIDLRDSYMLGEQLPVGMTLTYVQPTGGAGDPDITNAIAGMGAQRWSKVCMPYNGSANWTLISNELLRRFGPMVQLDGIAHAWNNQPAGSGSGLSTLLTLGLAWNTPFISCTGSQGMLAPAFVLAARSTARAMAAAVIDPPRQLRTLQLFNELPPAPADRWTADEIENLLQDGIAVDAPDASGLMANVRSVTMYRLNNASAPDISYRDVETMEVLAAIRADIRGWVPQAFPRWKLADDATGTTAGSGTQIMTPKYMKAALATRGLSWANAGWIQDYPSFVQLLNSTGGVTRDNNDPDRLNALVNPPIINNFRTFAVDDQFILNPAVLNSLAQSPA